MSKNEDLRPISPLGQKFSDMNDFFTMIRKDAHKVLAQQGTVEKALTWLARAQSSIPNRSTIHMHSSLGHDPLIIEYLSHPPTDERYWRSLYTLLKDAGFKDRGEILNESSKFVDSMTIGGRSIPLRVRDQIGEVAHTAFNEVYRE